jgi:hypothetical protein
MTTNARSWMVGAMAGLLLLPGCLLDGDGKDSCRTQADCLDGYTCIDQECSGGGGGGSGDDGGDDGSDPGNDDGAGGGGGSGAQEQFGTVAALAAASLGLASVNDYQTVVSLTTAGGGLGCAMVGDEDASPGTAAAMLSVKPDAADGDDRCPEGTFGILDDEDICGYLSVSGLHEGCAAYRAWDASGEPSAFRLATGGYVTITATPAGDQVTCDVELSVSFAGGPTIADAFSFEYDPLAPDGAFCTH